MSTVPMTTQQSNPQFGSGMDIVQLLMLANNYGRGNASAGSASDAFSNASGVYTDRMQKTNDYTDSIARVLSTMYGDPNSSAWTVPSTTGGSKAYMDAARYGDPTPTLQGNLGIAGNVVLQHLLQADDLTTRQIPIADYSTAGVANEAAKKFRNLSPSVDRAAAIASSAGFADALKRGVANSTQAAGTADELTRKFSDVYSKLEQQANDSALAENQANYKDYLGGVSQQLNQNQVLGTLANQLLGTTANVFTNTQNAYAQSGAQSAARLLQALQLGDSASLNSRTSSLAPLLQALVQLNGQGLNTAQSRFGAAATANQTAQTNQGSQLANVMGNPLVAGAFNWLGDKAKGWWNGGSGGGDVYVGSAPANSDTENANRTGTWRPSMDNVPTGPADNGGTYDWWTGDYSGTA
jgi:hypothetical protein